jgi:DNA-binding MarR family transcriptional regulator
MKLEDEIKQKKFRSPYHKALVNLIYTCNWVESQQQAYFKEFGITGQQFNILRILKGQHPKGISSSEIKSRMLDRNSDVSRLLDRLIAKALVKKVTCPDDKRATDVYITQTGLALLKEIGKSEDQTNPLNALSEEEAQKLSDLLDKCRD